MSKIEVRVTHQVSHANIHNAFPGATVRNFVPGSIWPLTEAMVQGNPLIQMCLQRGIIQIVSGELSRDLCVSLGIPTRTAVVQAAAKAAPVVEEVATPIVEEIVVPVIEETIVPAVEETVQEEAATEEVISEETPSEEPAKASKKRRKGKAQ